MVQSLTKRGSSDHVCKSSGIDTFAVNRMSPLNQREQEKYRVLGDLNVFARFGPHGRIIQVGNVGRFLRGVLWSGCAGSAPGAGEDSRGGLIQVSVKRDKPESSGPGREPGRLSALPSRDTMAAMARGLGGNFENRTCADRCTVA